ncbi:MAG: hypothetical protein GAK37_01151 [Pseudomonas sp.]|nr:MAG: hypothetical protein GAK37_01151 [Pseudomonas sp.]
MDQAPCISQIATLLADPKRTALLWALMDGAAKPVDELATCTGVSSASAKAHLHRLAASGLLRMEARDNQRFFQMVAPDVRAVVDALAMTTMASVARSGAVASLPLAAPAALRGARVCRGHLGGVLAADLYPRLLAAGWLERHEYRVQVTPKGVRKLAGFGIFTQALAQPVACECFDWSEQKPHLGGALGAALLQLFIQAGWVNATNASPVLQVSALGREEITRLACD